MSDYAKLRARLGREDPRAPREEGSARASACPNLAGHADAAPLYGPDDLEAIGFDPVRDLGVPGRPPFTRGVQPNMYRGRLWTMRQYAGFGTARESNERYRYLLVAGADGAQRRLRPARRRWAATRTTRAPAARSAASASPSTRSRTCARSSTGLPLDKISTSMTINATAAILLCLYVAVAEEQGVARAALRGTIQNDILKEYIARGTYIHPPRPSIRLITDIFAWCAREVPAVEHDLHQRLPHPRGRARTPRRSSRSRWPTGSRT